MSIRFTGLVPAVALLIAGTAQAQQATIPPSGAGGAMAYPAPLPSGQFKVTAPTQPDTGSMAYPNSGAGGIRQQQAPGADTGNMAYPTTGASSSTVKGGSAPMPPKPMTRTAAMAPVGSMRPDVAPTPAQTATARSLESTPSSQPVPYTDFLPPARPGKMMKKPMMHHAVMTKKAPAKATPAAAPAPAAPAK